MEIHISLPITGHPIAEVRRRAETIRTELLIKNHVPVLPFDVSPNPDAPYAEHIGRDISALLQCEAALFLDGWMSSKGCRLEMEAAQIYGKKIYFEYDLRLNRL